MMKIFCVFWVSRVLISIKRLCPLESGKIKEKWKRVRGTSDPHIYHLKASSLRTTKWAIKVFCYVPLLRYGLLIMARFGSSNFCKTSFFATFNFAKTPKYMSILQVHTFNKLYQPYIHCKGTWLLFPKMT